MSPRSSADHDAVRSTPSTDTYIAELTRLFGRGRIRTIAPLLEGEFQIKGVWLYGDDAEVVTRGCVALMAGADLGSEHAAEVIKEVAEKGCAAAVVSGPFDAMDEARLRELAEKHRIALFENCGVSWLELADALRHAERDQVRGNDPVSGGIASGNLLALSEGLAEMLGGPVIIEDVNFHVLAYSTLTGTIDHGRDVAILGGRIPDLWLKHLENIGALEILLSSERVIDIVDGPYAARRRLLCSIRVDNYPLGILWVAEGSKPLAEDIAEKLGTAARMVVPHLLRYQEENLGQRAAQFKMLRTLIETGVLPRSAAEELDLAPAEAYVVIALRRAAVATFDHTERKRVVESVSLFCQSYRWHSVTTAIGHTVYCLIALVRGQDFNDARRLALGLSTNLRLTIVDQGVQVAISELGSTLAGVPKLRVQVDQVLDVRARPPFVEASVLRYRDAVAPILLDQLSELLLDKDDSGFHKLETLKLHDSVNRTEYVQTTRVYLMLFGNTTAAAHRLGLHATTLRYRLKRIAELSGLDFENPDERLLCELLLRKKES